MRTKECIKRILDYLALGFVITITIKLAFDCGRDYGAFETRKILLPPVVHSFKNVSVSRNGVPFELTFRVSYADGRPFADGRIRVNSDSGYVYTTTDENGFARVIRGESRFDGFSLRGENRVDFDMNLFSDLPDPDLGVSGLDFTIILD
jgi:hypothetical protein